VRQLDSSITASRKLHLACYGIGALRGIKLKDHWEFIQWLQDARFPVPYLIKRGKNIHEVKEVIKEIEEKRKEFPFEADGSVIKVNDFDIQKKLGVKTREPRWALAYKFPAHQGTTVIKKIITSVGRIGTITPVAFLKPVQIGGVTVSRSTLHNWDEIKRKDIRVGDTVVIERAGDVIPHVIAVIKDKRTGREKPFPPPKKCPVCGSMIEREEGEVAYRCIGLNCDAQVQERIRHYVSRPAMDIEGLGEKNVELLYSHGLIRHFTDIYRLRKEYLIALPRFAERSKETTLARFIFSLGILHVGEYSAKLLARNFRRLKDLYNVGPEQIVNIKQMGEKIAVSIAKFFNEPENMDTLDTISSLGITISNPDYEGGKKEALLLDGLTFVITGTLPGPRSEIEGLIESNGGHVSGSVSKKTDYVVLGKEPGSKLGKARSLEIKTISYNELLKMLAR
jgi:DNA ligase (NAD+)